MASHLRCLCLFLALVASAKGQSNVRDHQAFVVRSCREEEAHRDSRCQSVTDVADVRCCNMAGDECVSLCPDSNRWQGENRTFEDAKSLCSTVERRLCMLSEYRLCCATGCGFSVTYVWMGDEDLCAPITYEPTPVVTTTYEPVATRVPTPAPTECASSVCPTPAPALFGAYQHLLGADIPGSNPIPADFDNDGDVDVFVLDESPRLFINDGEGSFSEFSLNGTRWGFSSAPLSTMAIDINFDSYTDVLVCGIGYVAYLKHCGTQCPVRGFRFDLVTIESDDRSTFRCPDVLARSSGEGVRGVVAIQQGRETSSLRVYENRGTLLNPVWQLQYPLAASSATASAAVGELTTSAPFSNVEFREFVYIEDDKHMQFFVSEAFSHQRNGTYLPSTELFDSPLYDLDFVTIVDLDQDGRNDILGASQATNSIVWFRSIPPTEASSSLRFSEARRVAVHYGSGVFTVVAEDLNLDGHLDVISASNNFIQWCPNNGDGSFARCQTITFADFQTEVFANVRMADVDGDGDLDIVADVLRFGDESLRVIWFENTRLPEMPPRPPRPLIEEDEDDLSLGSAEFAGIVVAVLAFGACCGFAISQYRKLNHQRLVEGYE